MKFMKRKYPDENFPYKKKIDETYPHKIHNELYDTIVNFKINAIKNGLMEASLNKIDKYLIGIFKPYEKKDK